MSCSPARYPAGFAHHPPAPQAVESSSRPRVGVCDAICSNVTALCRNKPVDLLVVSLEGCTGGSWLWCVWPQQVPWGLINPAWPGRGLVKAPPLQTSIPYSPKPGSWEREDSSLLEEQSPCKAISLPVTDYRDGDQKGKAPGACLLRPGCLATPGALTPEGMCKLGQSLGGLCLACLRLLPFSPWLRSLRYT